MMLILDSALLADGCNGSASFSTVWYKNQIDFLDIPKLREFKRKLLKILIFIVINIMLCSNPLVIFLLLYLLNIVRKNS